jgi:hypothetical protein
MGQQRPVRVIHFVTRATIEERVLRTLDMKRSLFESVFKDERDEIDFEALNQRPFLETVREIVGEEGNPAVAEAAADPRQAVVQAGVQLLEAIASLYTRPSGNGQAAADGTAALASFIGTDARTGQPVLQVPLPAPEVLQRGAQALQAILTGLAGKKPEDTETHG